MILAIDTATRWTGLALYADAAVLAEHGWHSPQTQTMELAPSIEQLLQRSGTGTDDLEGIAVAIGPGSYTGLRIGLALAKGLALALGIPLIGVSTLDIVAAAVGPMQEPLIITAEAGRRRVCAGAYRWQKRQGWEMTHEPQITSWEALLAGLEEATVFAGEISPTATRLIRASGGSHRMLPPAASVRRAGYLGEIGWQRLRKGQVDDASQLVPDYLRDPPGS